MMLANDKAKRPRKKMIDFMLTRSTGIMSIRVSIPLLGQQDLVSRLFER